MRSWRFRDTSRPHFKLMRDCLIEGPICCLKRFAFDIVLRFQLPCSALFDSRAVAGSAPDKGIA